MKKILAIIFFVVAVASCFFGAFYNIENRAIHADEAEQATTFLKLYRDGEYKYNPNGPHGPTLYYWALAAEKISEETPPDEVEISQLRKAMLPVLALSILSFFVLSSEIGLIASLCAAAIFACTALAQIYGVYFVQEIIFSITIFLSAIFAWRFIKHASVLNALLLGTSAGLAQATKETSVIAFASIFFTSIILCLFDFKTRKNIKNIFSKSTLQICVLSFSTFAVVVALFYSSFGENPVGIFDAFKSYFIHFFDKASMPEHSSSAWFYIKLLFVQKSSGVYFGEIVITIFALLGTILATVKFLFGSDEKTKQSATTVLFFAFTSFINIVILCCISYKTPWLLLSPIMMMCVPAGYFVGAVFKLPKNFSLVLAIIIASAMYYQYTLTHNAVQRFNSDPRNPFIYSHTVSDEKNLYSRLLDCIKFSSYKNDIPIAFVGKVSPWPLPWQLRNQPNAGFWQYAPQNINDFDVVITDAFTLQDVLKNIDTKQYSTDLFGLRKNTILTVFIKKDIFEKIISQ